MDHAAAMIMLVGEFHTKCINYRHTKHMFKFYTVQVEVCYIVSLPPQLGPSVFGLMCLSVIAPSNLGI